MFDTHCHLQFSRFKKNVDEVIKKAKNTGVNFIVVPGTDVDTSTKAIDIAQKNNGIYAAVGIHPHHVYDIQIKDQNVNIKNYEFEEISIIENLLQKDKVVAVGEVGMDRHVYEQTKYKDYAISDFFIQLQAEILKKQIYLAIQYNKSLILHNREAKAELFKIMDEVWDTKLAKRTVLHCCEPDEEILQFAKVHDLFIGVDGDITYTPAKQEFIKKIPLDRLVLETDSPFLLPEPLRAQRKFPNEPANIPLIAEFIAQTLGISAEELGEITTKNAQTLFQLPQH